MDPKDYTYYDEKSGRGSERHLAMVFWFSQKNNIKQLTHAEVLPIIQINLLLLK